MSAKIMHFARVWSIVTGKGYEFETELSYEWFTDLLPFYPPRKDERLGWPVNAQGVEPSWSACRVGVLATDMPYQTMLY